MRTGPQPKDGALRRAMIALAFVALALQAAIPPGFMPSGPQARGAPALVICTGHGALKLAGDKAPPVKRKGDAPCAFAGNTPPIAAAAFRLLVQAYNWSAPRTVTVPPDQSPGRGMAAPPPPPLGPPSLT